MGFTSDSSLIITPEHLAQLQGKVDALLGEAARQGASACEAVAQHSVRAEASTLGEGAHAQHTESSLGLAVYRGQQRGVVRVDLLDPAFSPTEIVGSALRLATAAEADPFAGLANPDSLAFDYPELNLYFETPIDSALMLEQVQTCEAAGLATDQRIVDSRGTSLTVEHACRVHGNSHGFLGSYAWSQHALSCYLRAAADGEKRSGGFQDLQRQLGELSPFDEAGQAAARRAISYLGGQAVQAGTSAVVFAPEAAQFLLAGFIQAITGKDLDEGSSFLFGRLDQAIFGSGIAIEENPLMPSGLGSLPFDADGVRVAGRAFVDDGRLVSYALDVESARRLGLANTGNAVANPFEVARNLCFAPGTLDQDGLLRQMDSGVLVVEARPPQLDLRTGNFSQRAMGFEVRGGEVGAVLAPLTLSGNLADVFSRLLAIGSDQPMTGRVRTGSVLVEQIAIA
jgi:PmbA protein